MFSIRDSSRHAIFLILEIFRPMSLIHVGMRPYAPTPAYCA